MKHDHRNTVLFVTTVLGLGIAPTAMAQEAGDIIVTAQRVEERLRDVPISISVFNQDQIDQRNVTSVSDLATYTPSLSNNGRFGPTNSSFVIRGFVQDPFTAPSVGVYFAEALSPRNGGQFVGGEGAGPGSFFDLQNVQVLKGPQGTLFGRNTTGGAVLLVPKKPSDNFEGYVEGSHGNYDMTRLQAVVNAPLSETIRARIGFDNMSRDGYLRNFGVGSKHLGSTNYFSARASLAIDFSPELENYTIASYTDSRSNGFSEKTAVCDATKIVGATGRFPAIPIPLGAMACAQIARQTARGDGFYGVENSASDPHVDFVQWQVINHTTWSVSDHLTIKNIASYGQLKNNSRLDPYGNYFNVPTEAELVAIRTALGLTAAQLPSTLPQYAGVPIGFGVNFDAPGFDNNNQWTFSEEFQLRGTALSQRLKWQAGVYYEKSAPVDGFIGSAGPSYLNCSDTSDTPVCQAPYGTTGRLSLNLAQFRTENLGFYGQASFDITDRLQFTGGIRHTTDKSEGIARLVDRRFLPTGEIASVTCQVPAASTPAPVCRSEGKQSTRAWTWVADVTYKPIDPLMVYAKYSRGYRAGLVNPRAPAPLNEFGAERVDTYEIGAKASWSGALPGAFNVAGFYNDFTDQQLLVTFINAAGQSTSSICSCGTSTIKGIELDGTISPFEGFDITGAYGYLDTKLKAFDGQALPGYTVRPNYVVGLPLQYAPKNKWSLTGAYTLPLDEAVGKLTVSATYSHTDDYRTGGSALAIVEGYGLLNLNLNWDNIGGKPIDLALFGTNVTGKKYFVNSNDVSTLGFVNKALGQPAMYGARVRVNF